MRHDRYRAGVVTEVRMNSTLFPCWLCGLELIACEKTYDIVLALAIPRPNNKPKCSLINALGAIST